MPAHTRSYSREQNVCNPPPSQIPQLANIPILTSYCYPNLTMLSWTLKPSLAYVGQGMIMGLRVAGSSMIGGALAWGFLGPMALTKAWVGFTAEDKPDVEGYPDNIELYGGYPDILFDAVVDEETGVCAPTIDPSVRGEGSGPANSTTPPNLSECEQAVSSYEYGAKGWLTWLSLAIMLAEALTSLSFLALKQIGPACKAACGGDGAEVRTAPTCELRHMGSSPVRLETWGCPALRAARATRSRPVP